MREEVINILNETSHIINEREKKIKKEIKKNTNFLEENIFRQLSSEYLEGEERLNIILNFISFDEALDTNGKNIMMNEKDNILFYQLGDNLIPIYYKDIIYEFSYEGFIVSNISNEEEIKYQISINRKYYLSLIRRNSN